MYAPGAKEVVMATELLLEPVIEDGKIVFRSPKGADPDKPAYEDVGSIAGRLTRLDTYVNPAIGVTGGLALAKVVDNMMAPGLMRGIVKAVAGVAIKSTVARGEIGTFIAGSMIAMGVAEVLPIQNVVNQVVGMVGGILPSLSTSNPGNPGAVVVPQSSHNSHTPLMSRLDLTNV